MSDVLWFADIRKDDINVVGGKGANLGEMTSFGMPVPPGFVVSANAYRQFLIANKLEPQIKKLLSGLDVNNSKTLDRTAKEVQKLILKSPVPANLAAQIIKNYFLLNKRGATVAVRSSATSEDSKEASFAGQNRTILNVSGEAVLVEAVRQCWASLFEARSIFYRVQNHFDHLRSYIAVVVQQMIPAEVSGIVFSIDPVTNNRRRVVIEAVWGLGEYIVGGKVTPDHYEVSKEDLTIVEKKVIPQKIMLGARQLPVPKTKMYAEKLSDMQIRQLAKLSIDLEKHYYFPQDSEFAVYKNKIYLVQTRPITTIKEETQNLEVLQKEEKKLEVILTGAPASPGIRSGPVQVLKDATEIGLLKPGDVLVAQQTNPDYVPAMKRAAAIVTDRGGRTSHAAIVSRELGIPAVVGTERATQELKNDQVVTVDGGQGKVFRGAVNRPQTTARSKIIEQKSEPSVTSRDLKTATKIYVNLAEPDEAKRVAALNCDGVGLLRAEFMLAGIGVHPKKIIKDHQEKTFIKTLTDQLLEFAQAFYPRPVVYRATDFKTNEYRALRGGEDYEPEEANPMIGFRGAFRYTAQPEVFAMELAAIKNVRRYFNNLWLMIPFCRTVTEFLTVKKIIQAADLSRSPSFKLWLMCEIPANVILLDKFLGAGVDGISVGSNDLTMLTLGVDRDNENVASVYNELDPALLFSFYKIAKVCRQFNVTCSMCGQAPSDFPQLTQDLIKWGYTSVSVNPDAITRTRQIVYEAEKKLISHGH